MKNSIGRSPTPPPAVDEEDPWMQAAMAKPQRALAGSTISSRRSRSCIRYRGSFPGPRGCDGFGLVEG